MSVATAALPVIGFVDANGRPAFNGKVTTYLAGTTTLAPTYQDATGTVPNANPIPLNARGEATIWFDPELVYDLVPKLSNGTSLPRQQNITAGTSLSGSDGSDRVGFIQRGTGALRRTMQGKNRDIISVKDYGAVGDGIADDTAAIQTAIAAATSFGGARVDFPTGTYKISSTIQWNANGITLTGHGEGCTQIVFTAATGDIFSIGNGSANPNNCAVREMSITATVPKTSGAAVRFQNGHNCKVSHVRLDANMFTGFQFDGGPQQFLYYLENFEVNSGTYGVRVGTTARVQDITIGTGIVANTTLAGYSFEDVSGLYGSHFSALGCLKGIWFNPIAGQIIKAVFFHAIIADTCNDHGWQFTTTSTGRISDVNLTSCWGSTCGQTTFGHGLTVDAGATVRSLAMTMPRMVNNQGSGMFFASGSGIDINDPQCLSNSQRSAGLKHGIEFAAGVSDWQVAGGKCGLGGEFVTNPQGYGICVDAGSSNRYSIIGVDVNGNLTANISDGGAGPDIVIFGCSGFRTNGGGTAAIPSGSSSVTFPHGLALAPTRDQIQLTPLIDLNAAGIARYWVSAVDGTNITITVNAATTAIAYFAWSARIKAA